MNLVPLEVPAVLQAHRGHLTGKVELADPAGKIELLQKALDQACDYGQQLWHQLDAQRRYLLGCLPPAPPLDTPHPIASGASPTGPGDETGWEHWMTAYAETTSTLAGPRGDSGYGRTEAEHEMRTRCRARQDLD
ncbi:hypothetical protein M6D93_12145 [Jatrophihabitans telluris]|uniref:Uncharacterized protein n=1 Tax=Jatrophihabitans telluris TaxID=2038343 RepID=A0ABY4QTL3_9ACTN|nr:hypothetical protein [Jatrophihabitans telluris]UQX87056.1 hypothetical protein M6D93_12145 [Jatrophihabitans telluris]